MTPGPKQLLSTLVLASLTCAAGCYAMPEQRQKARDLSVQIADYRDAQKERIEQLNRDYHQKFDTLMQAFVKLTQAELQQGRDADAQRIADQIIDDRNSATLRGTFRETFGKIQVEERARITQADLAVVATRGAYLQAYQDARLELAKLNDIEAALQSLGAKENQFATAASFVQTVIKVHDDLKKEAAAKEGKSSQAATP